MIPLSFSYHSAIEVHLVVPDPNKYFLVICPKNILVCIVYLCACLCCKFHNEEAVVGYSLAPLELNCSLLCQVHFHTYILTSQPQVSVMLPKGSVAKHND